MTSNTLPTADAGGVLERVRSQRPVVHCLTNAVTIGRVADALAALGARPVMASAEEEAVDMVRHAQALLLNLGTPAAARWEACRAAGAAAKTRGVPVVIDPVGCGATLWRTEQARLLVRDVGAPDVVRGNIPEVTALAGLGVQRMARQRGIAAEVAADVLTTEVSLERLAREASRSLGGGVVVVTGPTNAISDGQRVVFHTTGVAALSRVIGAGDVLSAVIAACSAVETDCLASSLAGLTLFTAAAQSAAAAAGGPGSFWPHFVDRLSALTLEGVEDAP